jgi:hypothetical protein
LALLLIYHVTNKAAATATGGTTIYRAVAASVATFMWWKYTWPSNVGDRSVGRRVIIASDTINQMKGNYISVDNRTCLAIIEKFIPMVNGVSGSWTIFYERGTGWFDLDRAADMPPIRVPSLS